MIDKNTVLGWIVLVVGVGVIVASLGTFIMQLLFAYFGYMLINYGLALLGKPPIQWWIMQLFIPFGRGGF